MGYNIVSVSQYLEVIKILQNSYSLSGKLDFSSPTFLYRGMSDCKYTLLPKVLRGKKVSIEEYDKAENDKLQDELKHQLAERPSDFTMWATEKELLKQFIQEASGYVDIPANNLLRWAEYAQHYGVPTRFLDWTTNPLTALYFSLRENHQKNKANKRDGVVWLLNKANYELFLHNIFENICPPQESILTLLEYLEVSYHSYNSYPILYTPNYVDSRMSAQGSYFTVWGNIELPLDVILENAPDTNETVEISQGIFGFSGKRLYNKCYIVGEI